MVDSETHGGRDCSTHVAKDSKNLIGQGVLMSEQMGEIVNENVAGVSDSSADDIRNKEKGQP
jgi:hypothetical protein